MLSTVIYRVITFGVLSNLKTTSIVQIHYRIKTNETTYENVSLKNFFKKQKTL